MMKPGFEEEIGLIKKVIVDFWDGHRSNLAVVSDPFRGETELMDEVEGMIGEEGARISARSLFRDLKALNEAPGRIVVVEEAHRLYQRKVGGFEAIDRFLNMLLASERLFITTWNSVSWKYLDEVIGLSRHFPQKIRISRMSADEIRKMILSGYEEEELTFLEEELDEEELKIFNRASRQKTLAGHSFEIPYPAISSRSIRSRMDRTEKKSAEEIFFDRLASISDGNPGVAELLWKEALDYPEVRNVLKDPPSIDLHRDESFALCIVLSMGSVEMEYLSEVLEPLGISALNISNLLEEMGLVTIDGEVISVRALALKSIFEHLRRARLVW